MTENGNFLLRFCSNRIAMHGLSNVIYSCGICKIRYYATDYPRKIDEFFTYVQDLSRCVEFGVDAYVIHATSFLNSLHSDDLRR